MTCRVINLHNTRDRSAVAIDRRGPWGNPFKIGIHGTRPEVLRLHEGLLVDTPEMVNEIRWRLANRSLACWCDPQPCHGWLLFWVANCSEEDLEDWLLGRSFWTEYMIGERNRGGYQSYRPKEWREPDLEGL